MIRISPGRSVAFKEAQQLSSPHRFPGGFDQEGAAAPGPDNRIGFLHQIMRQQNMGAFTFYKYTR
jgi:hypothetical protein